MDLEPDWFYQSEEEFACYGESVVCGDMNADGYDDFIVGAPFDLVDKPGRIYIYSGGDTLSTTPVYVYGQFNPGSWLGRKMVYVSNWNNSDYGMVLAGWISTEDYSNGVLKISGASEFDSLKYDTTIIFKDTTFFSLHIENTIDLNNDKIDDLIFLRILDSDDVWKRIYLIDIYSSQPFPLSNIHKDYVIKYYENYLLEPNYPNPFNIDTNIQFYIPQSAYIKISVYDVLGRKLTVLADSPYQSGFQSIHWNAKGLPSGIYFIKMTVDNGKFHQIRKAMLLK